MAEFKILTLHLRRSLRYFHDRSAIGKIPYLRDGQELLVAYRENELFGLSPDGPYLVRGIQPCLFSGYPATKAQSEAGAAQDGAYSIEEGSYAFAQWNVQAPAIEKSNEEDFAWFNSLIEPIEAFARTLWWQGAKTKGPYFLRVLKEDGRMACQALRLLDTEAKAVSSGEGNHSSTP